MGRLTGKSAIVIGAATGIGRAVCEAFAREGADIMIADRGHETERKDLVARLAGVGARAADIECDVLVERQVETAIAGTIAAFGKLDIVVSNAGAGAAALPFQELSDAEWDRIVNVNLRGVAFAMRHALPPMLERGQGRIINTASQLAHKTAPWYAIYCASKAAVVALSSSVAQEVAKSGVTINCVCPGPTDTKLWRDGDANWNSWKASSLPIGRIASPEDIAGAYVYLASDEASFMIGQSVSPNGGDVMW